MSKEELFSDLTAVLETNRPALQTLSELLSVLEKDILQTCDEPASSPQQRVIASVENVHGAVERHRSLFYVHETRLAQLKHLHSINPADTKIQPLLMHFAGVYASVEDRTWILNASKSNELCERNVDGLLPYGITLFLGGEGQIMLAKFLKHPTSWKTHVARMEAHEYWVTSFLNGLLRGHALSHPLHLLLIELKTILQTSREQQTVHESFWTLNELQQRLPDVAQQRVLNLELKHLASLCQPFPNRVMEGEE